MTSADEEIAQWAATIPYWEQVALDLILAGAAIGDPQYDLLLQLLLEDAQLTPTSSERKAITYGPRGSGDRACTGPPRLLALSNLKNINALAKNQTLTFGPGLTAAFGANGSGKSGYARVLGCAGFTRGDREVLPDITKPIDETTILSAQIEIQDGDATRVINYRIGERCPELSGFYVFDSTSVRVHLCQSNLLSFSPAGLSELTTLAEVTDAVRARLQQRIDACQQPHTFDRLFVGVSDVADIIAPLGPSTDLDRLRALATPTPEEHASIGKLDLEIARIKSREVSKEILSRRQTIADLENLASRLRSAETSLSKESADRVFAASKAVADQKAIAEQVGVQQFQSSWLSRVGTDPWYQFARAARSLAESESLPGEPYPKADSICLLCQQPLSPAARGLLFRLWQFLEGEVEARLNALQANLAILTSQIASTSFTFLNEDAVTFRYLNASYPALLAEARGFLGASEVRREAILSIRSSTSKPQLPPLPLNPAASLDQVIAELQAQLERLEHEDTASTILALEQQKTALDHRVILAQNLGEIAGYVQQRAWAEKAVGAGGSTAHITRLHNKLFSNLVTDRYIELFQELLGKMGRTLSVKVATKGRKGEVFKQIVVQADPSARPEIATPEKVLSEGEKRAVALADFLTEVALDTTSSGIILDDPVTSLDLEWRELIASILVQEAARRQVIVFTHDLPFLYFLKREADDRGVQLATHWIKRGDTDDIPGYVYLDNSPALEKDYRTSSRARDVYARAKTAPPEEQESLLREGFGALRTSYEAFIIFDLFNEVVMRFDERVSFGRLKEVVINPAMVERIVEACERLSRLIEGHLHSDTLEAQKPTPRTLLEEIEAFDALRANHKELLKAF